MLMTLVLILIIYLSSLSLIGRAQNEFFKMEGSSGFPSFGLLSSDRAGMLLGLAKDLIDEVIFIIYITMCIIYSHTMYLE